MRPTAFHTAPWLILEHPSLGNDFNWDHGPNLFLNDADMVFFKERY